MLDSNSGEDVKRVLFVCSANVDRSPTAEQLCKRIYHIEAKSAGVAPYALNQVTKELVEWADKIFVMEERHKDVLLNRLPGAQGKIVVLNVPDDYCRNQPELVQIFRDKLRPILGEGNAEL